MYLIVAIPQIIISAAQPFILIIFPKLIIDTITQRTEFQHLVLLVITMAASSAVILISQAYLQSLNTIAYNKMSFRLTSALGLKAMQLRYQDVENPNVLDLFNKVQRTLNIGGISESISKIVSSLLTLIGLVVIISRLNLLVFVVIIVIVAINVACDSATKKYDYEWQKEAAPFQRKFSYFAGLMCDFKYGKEIRINQLKDYFKGKYDHEVDVYSSRLKKIIYRFLRLNSIRGFSSALQELFMYFYLAFKAFRNEITIGDFTMFISAITSFTNSLNDITGAILELRQQSRFINDFRVFTGLQSADEIGKKVLPDITGGYVLEFDHVSFKYPLSEQLILKDVSIQIKQGEKLSIVGLNGAGKTTFVKLLTRLYEPTDGRILLNGVNINEINIEDYMTLFAVVFQDYQLFAFSVEENITLNKVQDENKIIDAVQNSGLYEKISSLPNQCKTHVFKIFDQNGIEFSGGESQKMVISRAIYKDAPIIILDEPTASLDPIAEYEIYMHFNALVKNKTAIYISHRLSSTKFCNSIAVFENGKIVQHGTHDELVNEGLYSEMYSKQAGFYTNEKGVVG